jgi:hypothetical protein
MSDHDDKIVSLTGDPVHFNAPEGQLFSPSDVMEGTMASEPVELLTIARRHDGSMIVHGTHNIAAANGGYIVEEGAKDPRCYPRPSARFHRRDGPAGSPARDPWAGWAGRSGAAPGLSRRVNFR